MQNISVIDPINTAWREMQKILFRPFDLGRCFALGFSAWLAFIGAEGSGGLDWIGDLGNSGPVGDILRAHFALFIAIVSSAVALAAILAMVFMWLRGRGKFMFLDNLLQNRAEIVTPWKKFKRQGNSYFVWLLIFGLGVALLSLLIIGAGFAIAWPDIRRSHLGSHTLLAILTATPPIVLLCLFAWGMLICLESFIIPIMYKYEITASEAWRKFRPLLRRHFWPFIVYLLFLLLLTIVAAAVIFLFGCLTCCCGFLILAIPYLNAVLLLPITVFLRLYSVYFLRQFGSEWDVTITAAISPATPPHLPEST